MSQSTETLAHLRGITPERGQQLARAILTWCATQDGPRDLFEIAHAIAPPPLNVHGHVDGRTRAGKRWLRDQLDIVAVAVDLDLTYGYLAEADRPHDTRPPWGVVITDAGLAYLGTSP